MENKKSIHAEVEAIKKREREELIEALREYGECADGGYEYHFEGEFPVIAGYSYDEPCDITVKAVRVNKHGDIYLIGDDGSDDDIEIDAIEIFAGHLDYVTSALVGKRETNEKGVWLVVQRSCVDGEHLYDVTPCICKETAIAVMNTKKEEVLDTYAEARGWMNGEHDEGEMDDCPYEWEESETEFFIQVRGDAYWEEINVEEKEIKF